MPRYTLQHECADMLWWQTQKEAEEVAIMLSNVGLQQVVSEDMSSGKSTLDGRYEVRRGHRIAYAPFNTLLRTLHNTR